MDLRLLLSNHALMMAWYPGQACRVRIYHVTIYKLKLLYYGLHNQFSSAQINSYNVVDDDTTNAAETSTMAPGNIVANYF